MKTLAVQVKAVCGDKVRITALESTAIILSVNIGRQCTLYEVAYFHNGERKSIYIADNEFTLVE